MGQRAAVSDGVTKFNTDLQAGFEDFHDDEKMIYWHEMGRQRCVMETLCYVHMYRLCKMVKHSPEVTEIGAMYQQLHAKQFFYPGIKNLQAAHMLPHQIMIDGVDITGVDSDERTQLGLRNLFGATNTLPTEFNNADLAYEKYGGGRQALADTIKAMIEATVLPPRTLHLGEIKLDRMLVSRIYKDVWVPKCHDAFNAGIAWLQDKSSVLDPFFRFQKTPEGEARFRRRLIKYLQGYDHILMTDTTCLSPWHFNDMERRLNNPDLEPAVLETNNPQDKRLSKYDYVAKPGF